LPDDNVRTWSYGPWRVQAHDEEDNLSGGDHENTPTTSDLDSLGRIYQSTVTPDGTTDHVTKLVLDVQGNVEQVIDPRENTIQVQRFDLLGRPLFSGAADEGYDAAASPPNGKGETRMWPAVDGQMVKTWRSGNLVLHRTYDALRRPVALAVDDGSDARLVEIVLYGDAIASVTAGEFANGRPWQVYDTAGRVAFTYDFRGRTVSETRQVLDDITADADWTGLETQNTVALVDSWVQTNGGLDAETFPVTTAYDALDRITEQVAPDATQTLAPSRTVYGYDTGGRLLTVDVHVHGDTTATAFVTAITYNARGQRETIAYGNHTTTTYSYDPERFWLDALVTQRSSASSHGSAKLQDLTYTRDAVGNLISITDAAQDTLYYNNKAISADRAFTYDSLYRLVQATGREKDLQTQTTAHYGGVTGYAGATSPFPGPGVTTPLMRRYTQTYSYDAAGNILQMHHVNAWTRTYAYSSDNNQLLSTSQAANPSQSDPYAYNDRGAMVFLPHLNSSVSANIVRDFRDQMRFADLPATDFAWYAYDSGGQRVRKVWDKGNVVEERIYVGPFEVWRQRDGGGNLQEERQTLHVMDDQRRIAMVETLTEPQGPSTTNDHRLRFQLDDHLGTATVEVDSGGGLITYEEYQCARPSLERREVK